MADKDKDVTVTKTTEVKATAPEEKAPEAEEENNGPVLFKDTSGNLVNPDGKRVDKKGNVLK